MKCNFCEGIGHKAADCSSNEYSEVRCFNCDGIGHYANKCASESRKEHAADDAEDTKSDKP